MGFTSGFAGGVTITLGVAYLTVLVHERNRQAQCQSARSQLRVLRSLYEPEHTVAPRSRAELAREERGTFTETAKDRWNDEISNAVRWVQTKDWGVVREGIEESVSRLWSGGLQSSRDGIAHAENQARPVVREAIEKTRVTTKNGINATADGIDRAAAVAISRTEKASGEATEGARRIAALSKERLREDERKASEYWKDAARAKPETTRTDARSGAREAADAIRSSGGTIDAARNAVRGVISKGIEKGKEVLGKAQSTVAGAEQTVEPKSTEAALTSPSVVERALQQRYEKRPEVSAREAWADRYQPIRSKDKTTLRGV